MNLIFFLAGALLALGLTSSQRAYVERIKPGGNPPSRRSWLPAAAGRYLLTAGFLTFAIQMGYSMLLCAFVGMFLGRWLSLLHFTNPRGGRGATSSHRKGIGR